MNYILVCINELLGLYQLAKIKNELKNMKLTNTSKCKIDGIHCITYRPYTTGGGGGGGAVMSMQSRLITKIDNINVKYTFKTEDGNNDSLSEFVQPCQFVLKNTLNDISTVYMTHDIGCAYALALMDKKYILVYHSQGPRLEERIGFKEKMGPISKFITKEVEKKAFENAELVCFPSRGAYEYYCASPFRSTNKENFVFGRVLYNTVEPRVPNFPKMDYVKTSEELKILSVGQLTSAKGIDQSLIFLEHLLEIYEGRVIYTLIGMGKQKKQLLAKLSHMKKKFKKLDYVYLPKVNYDEMQCIQKQSDCFLMLHRIAIFDLSILEMMSLGKLVVLSYVWGNKEYNLDDNIIYFNNDYMEAVNKLLNVDVRDVCSKNRRVANLFFSKQNFVNSYTSIIRSLVRRV